MNSLVAILSVLVLLLAPCSQAYSQRSTANGSQQTKAAMLAISENFNDRIKEEVANELTEILRSAAKQLQPGTFRTTGLVVYPGQGVQQPEVDSPAGAGQAAAASSSLPLSASDRFYMKKSLNYHQCYFNPISCFR